MDVDLLRTAQADQLRLLLQRPVPVAGTEAPAHRIAFPCHFLPDGLFHGIRDLLYGCRCRRIEQHGGAVLAILEELCDLRFDCLSDGSRQQDDLFAARQVLSDRFSLYGEGRFVQNRLRRTVIGINLPDTARHGKERGFLASIQDTFFGEILSFLESRIAPCFLCVDLQQRSIVDWHRGNFLSLSEYYSGSL